MYQGVYSFLIKNDALYDSQYGFGTKRSCEHAIQEMVGHLLQSRNENKHSIGIFLCLSKTFNMLDHVVLISKLEQYGI